MNYRFNERGEAIRDKIIPWKKIAITSLMFTACLGGLCLNQSNTLQQLKSRDAEASQKNTTLDSQLNELKKQNNDLDSQIKQKEEQVSQLNQQLSESDQKFSQLNQQLSEQEEQLSQLKQDKDNLNKEIKRLANSGVERYYYQGVLGATQTAREAHSINISIKKDKTVDIYLYNFSVDADMALLNSNGKRIAKSIKSGNATEVLGGLALSPGEYTLKIWKNQQNSSNYKVSIYIY